MRINHNISSLNTYRQLNTNTAATSKNIERLSSGLRINRAGDDAAGLAISEKMRGQIRGLDMAAKNSQDGISLIQTAEGALNETHSILQRMRELAVQSSNDTNTTQDRQNIQDEVNQLGEEIQRIAENTEFNTKKLLNGDLNSATAQATHVISNTTGGSNTNATTLDALVDADGNNVGIVAGDTLTASWSINGTQYSVTHTFAAGDDLDALAATIDAAASIATAATAGGAINVTSATAGSAGSVNGFSIEVKSGNVRKEAASNLLSNFTTTTAAADVHADGSLDFQIGSNQGQTLNLAIKDMSADTLGVRSLQVTTKAQAGTAIKVLDEAMQKVSSERSKLGAVQNRLEHTINNLTTSSENLTAAESRIRDTDMAKEMMEQTKNNILAQAAQAMLAQANQQPQGVLQLLR